MKTTEISRQKKTTLQNKLSDNLSAFITSVVIITLIVWLAWGGVATSVAAWAGAYPIITQSGGPPSPGVPMQTTATGAWGDSFGAFNALFGALGFAAVSFTLFLQYQSAENQKREAHVQRFESNFFEMINLPRDIRNEITFKTSPLSLKVLPKNQATTKEVNGHNAVRFAYREVKFVLDAMTSSQKTIDKRRISAVYIVCIHRRYGFSFSPYFRVIYGMLQKILDDEVLGDEEKLYYSRIIRSQLSTQEVALLGLNACCDLSKDMAEKVEHFRLLKYLPRGVIRTALSNVYEPTAFMGRD